ncbi:MAG TPA: GntR family transcriptional regulator [Anaerolineae bacterium]|nr:GntR family transcriptional regulator [Anaerolineae bacterium]HIQ04996.1 GntR family transcriptional regulator [Anaerolineae bacterium]
MSTREPIRIEHAPQRLSDAVFEALRKAVLDGKLAPGERLRQESLAQEMGVSQITVRDALNRLVGEGLAVRVPYKGVRVIALTFNDLEDIYAIRGLLEGLAAELAADRITPEELARMRELLPATIVDADPESVPRAREANREFHEIVIRASGRRFLIRILRQIWDWIDPMMLYGRTLETEQGAAIRTKWGERDRLQHTRLLEALEARDGQRARQVVAEYVEEAWNNLVTIISSPGESLQNS